jgi:hypothetical protein
VAAMGSRARCASGWDRARRRTGIEPAGDAARRPPVLKTAGATRHPDASGAESTVPPGRYRLRVTSSG